MHPSAQFPPQPPSLRGMGNRVFLQAVQQMPTLGPLHHVAQAAEEARDELGPELGLDGRPGTLRHLSCWHRAASCRRVG